MKTGIPSKFDGKCYICNRSYAAGTMVEGYDGEDKDGNPKKRYGHVDCVNAMGNQRQNLNQHAAQRPPSAPVSHPNDAMVDALMRIRAGIDEAIEIIRSAA